MNVDTYQSFRYIDSLEGTHPIEVLTHLREIYGDDLEVSFSRYRYNPQTRVDLRERFKVNVAQVDKAWLIDQLLRLKPEQELALESVVTYNGLRRHIPMLDFNGMAKDQLKAIMEVFPPELTNKIIVYYSGRSFHAYFITLLKKSEWIKFMGSALLCNLPHKESAVDQRWVGHRLIGGYAALRWSHNSSKYKSMPTKYDTLVLNDSYKHKVYLSRLTRENHSSFNKGNLYEQMVKELIIINMSNEVNISSFESAAGYPTDLVVRANKNIILLEVMYASREKLLNTKNLQRLARRISLFKDNAVRHNEYGEVKLILVTNAEVRESDKVKLKKGLNVDILFIENTLTRNEIIGQVSRVREFLHQGTLYY